jgi:hypothetical protein
MTTWSQIRTDKYWAENDGITYNAGEESWSLNGAGSRDLLVRTTWFKWTEGYRPTQIKISYTGAEFLFVNALNLIGQGIVQHRYAGSEYVVLGNINWAANEDLLSLRFITTSGESTCKITNISFSTDAWSSLYESETGWSTIEEIEFWESTVTPFLQDDHDVAIYNGIPHIVSGDNSAWEQRSFCTKKVDDEWVDIKGDRIWQSGDPDADFAGSGTGRVWVGDGGICKFDERGILHIAGNFYDGVYGDYYSVSHLMNWNWDENGFSHLIYEIDDTADLWFGGDERTEAPDSHGDQFDFDIDNLGQIWTVFNGVNQTLLRYMRYPYNDDHGVIPSSSAVEYNYPAPQCCTILEDTTGAGYYFHQPRVVIVDDTIHIVYIHVEAFTWKLKYINNSDGTWSAPVQIGTDAPFDDFDFLKDSQGNLHLFYRDAVGYERRYWKYDGSWTLQEIIWDVPTAVFTNIIIDKRDKFHFLLTEESLFYRMSNLQTCQELPMMRVEIKSI